MRLLLTIILIIIIGPTQSQNNAGKFDLEITKFKIGVNAGPYRGRTTQTNGPFDQGISGFGQIYFPFQWAVDYKSKFDNDTTILDNAANKPARKFPLNEYNKRIFLIRPSTLLHYVDNGSMAFGIGLQFSFLIVKQFYLEYQLSGVYVEANKAGEPDLHDGFNLHHFASISKPISRHFSLSIGFIHMSGAGVGTGKGANQDVISFGLKYNL